jgi:arsenite-transporting ATPase
MRIIFFAGKGGVGKTSVAAATGVKIAKAGHKTVILSLDVAHSLSDIFNLEKDLLDQNKGKPTEVQKNLWIQELDIQEEIDRNWGDIHKYLSLLLNTTGLDEILAEELAILPGMEEISLLLYINHYVKDRKFDVILLDCAPTGESLRFISIPTTLEWYIKKIFKVEKTMAKYIRPVAKKLYDIPLPDENYFDAIEHLFMRLEGVDKILSNSQMTTVRLVTNPEKVVMKETQRAFMYFLLHKMHIDAIVMNRILPDAIMDVYFTEWRRSQRKHIEEANTYFSPVPILSADLFKDEILGPERLQELASQIYGDGDPRDRYFDGEAFRLRKNNGIYQLSLKLPFITKDDIELNKTADELIIRIGSFKRHMLLPRQVTALSSVDARLEGQYLKIQFRGDQS